MAPEQMANISGRFWQANRGSTRRIGLGLSIAIGIVEANREELQLSGAFGSGSVSRSVSNQVTANGCQLHDAWTDWDLRK